LTQRDNPGVQIHFSDLADVKEMALQPQIVPQLMEHRLMPFQRFGTMPGFAVSL